VDVYTSMPATQASDYDDLKKALLKRYQLMEEGLRVRFRNSKPDKGEIVFQFVVRLMRYFSKCIKLSEIGGGLEELKDLLIREQFIQVCSTDLSLLLRERKPRNIEKVLTLTERYIEAHGGGITKSVKPTVSPPNRPPPRPAPSYDARGQAPSVPPRYPRRPICFACNKEGHFARHCPGIKKLSAGAMHDKKGGYYGRRNRPPKEGKKGVQGIPTVSGLDFVNRWSLRRVH
jgi:hypothetical protein